MPADLQMVQPDPSLPKEVSAFSGKWEGTTSVAQYFLIIEKIDEEKASLYLWRDSTLTELAKGWERYEAKIIKERGKYKLWFRSRYAGIELTLKGENLDWFSTASGTLYDSDMRLRRIP